ncbi:P-loop containing nucleoside triphosphate hydrolase protein [Bisporella sp. PMI_857]|nr:P-loop containing nucleoside triphosphate hydrolase protein [Bisporella sp. PMI_857]
MSTKLFQAVTMLSAQFRWCLTGTPVQNSLEDFAALLTFIHTSQLDSLPEFRKHIIMPLTRDTDQSINSFRLLLDSVCLRRTNKLLRLPQIVENYHYIELSSTEKNLYDKIQAERILAIKRQHNQSKATKDNLDFFQLELRLRLVCNHGTFQNYLSESALERLQFDAEQAFQSLRKQQFAKCKKCNLVVEGLDELKDRPGVFTVCGHLLCLECVGPYSMSVANDDHLQRKCLFCNRQLPKTFILTGPTISSPFFTKQSTFAKARESGATSSKVSALIHHIKTNEMPGKSIIFSCWTSSLDLIENHLVSERIKFARIDGNYSIPQRQKILEDFDQESEVQILLMTTGTGAVGLNLTVANYVYNLEPQWNPMVERQAIGRVQRIGQTRNVRVIRYIVEGTVEKKLKDQQGRKLGYAKLGWRQHE